MNEMLRRVFKRLRYPIEVILVCVRWYVAYPLSWRMDETYSKIAGQWKYLYRAIKRVTRVVLGFKTFCSARIIIAGAETMHMI